MHEGAEGLTTAHLDHRMLDGVAARSCAVAASPGGVPLALLAEPPPGERLVPERVPPPLTDASIDEVSTELLLGREHIMSSTSKDEVVFAVPATERVSPNVMQLHAVCLAAAFS